MLSRMALKFFDITLVNHTVHGVLGLPFPSPVDHILSDLSTMTRPSWVAPYGMAWFHCVRQACGSYDQIG